jgi:hypothetical protein
LIMLRRTMIAACPLAVLVGCGNTVNIPLDVKTIAEAVTGALFKFAPPALGAKLQAAYAALQSGGDWRVTARAFLDVADQIIATGVVPVQYAALATTALAGLRILLGFVAAGPNQVTMSQARDAAAQLRAMR